MTVNFVNEMQHGCTNLCRVTHVEIKAHYNVYFYLRYMVHEVYNHHSCTLIFERIEVHFCRSFLKNNSVIA